MGQAEDAVRIALGEVGKGYAAHRDCSGFTAWVYRQVGVTIPEGSVAQWSAGKPVTQMQWFEAGDLMFYDTYGAAPGHVAIYVGDGKIVHTLNEQRGIITSEWNAPMGGNNWFMGARRIFAPANSPVEDTSDPEEETPDPKVPHRRRRVRRLVHQRGDRH